MLIILDYDLPDWTPDIRKLGLEGNVLTLDGNIPDLGREEAVCFLTGLGNGGKAHQIRLIRDNPDIKRWIVVVFSRDADAVALYRENIEDIHADIRCIQWGDTAPEDLRRILEPSASNRCLIYAKRPQPGLNEFSDYLSSLLPGWEFSAAADCPDILRGSWPHLILAGNCVDDFFLELPDSLVQTPFFVLLHAPEAVQLSLRTQDAVVMIAEHFRKGFRWNRDKIAGRFFITNVLYEQWRAFCRLHPENIPLLRNDSRLSVWDRYGLPLPVDEVSDRDILHFLETFTGCAGLAAALRSDLKG